jgi:hypothetical protein
MLAQRAKQFFGGFVEAMPGIARPGLVVVVVRNDETFALEDHAVAAGVRARIAYETMVHSIQETMSSTIESAGQESYRSADQAAGYQFIGAVFFAEVAGNHLCAANRALNCVLECSGRNIPDGCYGHADQAAGEVSDFVIHTRRFRALRIGKARSCYRGEQTSRQK